MIQIDGVVVAAAVLHLPEHRGMQSYTMWANFQGILPMFLSVEACLLLISETADLV